MNSQANAVSQTSAAVAEIAENINSLERMIENQSRGVSQASSAVEQMIGNISSVNNSVAHMAGTFEELSQNAELGVTQQKKVEEQILSVSEQSRTLQDANKAIEDVGSQQIVDSLKVMNDGTSEVRVAGHEMAEGNRLILDEIHNLQESTGVIKTSVSEMSAGVQEISKTGNRLAELSSLMRKSVLAIGDEIDLFKS